MLFNNLINSFCYGTWKWIFSIILNGIYGNFTLKISWYKFIWTRSNWIRN